MFTKSTLHVYIFIGNNSKDVSLSPKPWVEVGPSHRPASLTARARPSLRDQSVRMPLHQPHFHVLLPPGQAQKKLGKLFLVLC